MTRPLRWLRGQGLTAADSDANFVLFGVFADRHAVWQGLLDRGVLIREVGPAGWLRVTIGTEQDMAAFRVALVEVLSMTRIGRIDRQTSETKVLVEIDLDGVGRTDVSTGVGFYDHMLTSFGKHGLFDLRIQVDGDLHIDAHHTVEDTAIALGQAFARAAGDKAGTRRFGDAFVPMDEALAQAVVDLSGRPYLVHHEPDGAPPTIGPDYATTLTRHVFESFTYHAARGVARDRARRAATGTTSPRPSTRRWPEPYGQPSNSTRGCRGFRPPRAFSNR